MDENSSTTGEMPEQPAAETVAEQISAEDVASLRAALKAANKEAAERRKRLDVLEKVEADRKTAEMTEVEKAKAETEQYRLQLFAAQRAAIAARHNLPETLAKRLQGETIEELEADAVELAASVPQNPQAPPISPTAPAATHTPTVNEIKSWTHDQINANWDTVQRVLASQKG